MTSPPSTLAAFGLCTDGKTVHTLPIGNSRHYARELMRFMDEYGTGTAPGQLKLHATLLRFRHPTSGKKTTFQSEPNF